MSHILSYERANAAHSTETLFTSVLAMAEDENPAMVTLLLELRNRMDQIVGHDDMLRRARLAREDTRHAKDDMAFAVRETKVYHAYADKLLEEIAALELRLAYLRGQIPSSTEVHLGKRVLEL